MKRNNIILIVIAIVTLLALVIGATYAYFATGNLNITNVVNANTVTEQNNMVFDTLGGGMILNITAANMVEAKQGNIAVENNTTLTVNFTPNTDYSMVCTYDIIYEWTSSDKYLTHTSGVTANEFTIQGTLASNEHVSQGTNSIKGETDLSALTYTNYAATVVSGAQIDGTGSTTSTAVWTISSKFYNVSADQSALSDKTYAGRFKVANVSCVAGAVTSSGPTSYWFAYSTWNSSVGNYDPAYTHPDHGGTLQTDSAALRKGIYVGQDSSKYYLCANDDYGHEACISQPYTKYGLEGHTLGNNFTSEQQENIKQFLYQLSVESGMEVDINSNCFNYDDRVSCYIGHGYFSIYSNGLLMVQQAGDLCKIGYDNRAVCGILGD